MKTSIVLDRLKYIEERILSAPMDEVTEDYFNLEEAELAELIQTLKSFPEEERLIIGKQVSEFMEKLKERLSQLKEGLHHIEDNMANCHQRTRGMQAYGKMLGK